MESSDGSLSTSEMSSNIFAIVIAVDVLVAVLGGSLVLTEAGSGCDGGSSCPAVAFEAIATASLSAILLLAGATGALFPLLTLGLGLPLVLDC